MKLVSVVIQAYNSQDTICETLDSIKKQTYPNIELIITDDKSRDNTVDVARTWLERNKSDFTSVKLITTESNTGIPGNNNRALKQVTGEYVEFLAADDYMMPNAIEELVTFCENNPRMIPISKVRFFSDEACNLSAVRKYCEVCYEFAQMDYKEQYHQLLMQNRVVSPAASFYPIEIIRELDGFDEHYKCFEDYPINLKLMKHKYQFKLLDKELIGYRISTKSITGSDLTPVKKDEIKLFFREKMWYMFQAGMGLEALKQSRYWIKLALKINKGL